VTELLSGAAEVRVDERAGTISAVRLGGCWQPVRRVANRWVVETDWWRAPVRRHYLRLLLGGGAQLLRAEGGQSPPECVELYRDLDTGLWHWSRRYD